MREEDLIINDNFFVITGGPGVGKTTLLNELERRNFRVVPEVAREIIKEQIKIGGDALPWKNAGLYKDLMLRRSIESYQSVAEKTDEITFFDRGIPDTLCYAKLINSPLTEELEFAADNYRYNEKIFLLPPWREIYETDNERKQTWAEAVRTYEAMAETYEKFAYRLIEVPKATTTKRAAFVIGNLLSERLE